jgi:diaminopimelate decarboxylase
VVSAVAHTVLDVQLTPRLPALMHPQVDRLVRNAPQLRQLVDGLGSPLHLLLPQVFAQNAAAFNEVLRKTRVDGLVMYAKKANKARSFVECCPHLALGVDAASVAEASLALSAGVSGRLIGISGPAKHPQLMRLAVQHASLVAMDSIDELRAFAAVAATQHRVARVLLRWRPESQPRSRFGMGDAELDQAINLCGAMQHDVALEGFSFHLSGYSAAERADAAHRLIDRCEDARRLGLRAAHVDIGGGFAVRYVATDAWRDFMALQAPQHYHAAKRFDDFYPYASDCHGPAMLEEILSRRLQAAPQSPALPQDTLAERLRNEGIHLLLEPGRALLDQAGITAFRVQGVKDRPGEAYGIVTVDGMSFSMSEQWFNSEYLPDPLLIGDEPDSAAPYAAAVAGASCLDSDMVTWRKLRLPRRPKVGDLLVYLNTAGYQMDSNESPFHDLPLPRKVAIHFDDRQQLHWRLDDVAPFSTFA